MAAPSIGKYHVNDGWVPAVVTAERDASGNKLADSATGDAVDVLLLGFSNGKRSNVTVGTDVNEFER